MTSMRKSILVFIPAVFLAAGCAGEAVSFNNSIAKVTKDLEGMGRAFGETLKNERDPGKLQAAHADLVARFKTLAAEANQTKVPAGKEAQDYWSAFQTYLKNQEKIVTDDFKDLINVMGTPNPDQGRLMAVFNRIQTVENADLSNLRQAQANFARANNMKLK